MTYAVASPSSDHGTEGQAKRPVRVYDLALKGTASGKRELPRTETKQFSLLGVSWTGATKRLHGTAQVRTRSSETGEWTAWKDLEANVDPLQDPEAGADARGASEPLWVGPSDGVQVQVVHKDGSTSSGLPKGLEVNLVDPGVATAAEQKAEAGRVRGGCDAHGLRVPDRHRIADRHRVPERVRVPFGERLREPDGDHAHRAACPPCPSRRSSRGPTGARTSRSAPTRRSTTPM